MALRKVPEMSILPRSERAEAPVIQQALKKGVLLFNEGVPVDEIEREITAIYYSK